MRWKIAIITLLLSGGSLAVYAAGKRAELNGVWILLRTDIGKVQLTVRIRRHQLLAEIAL